MTEELDLAPVSRPEPQGTWQAPPPEGVAWRVSEFGNAMDAADKAFQFDQDVYARRNALSDAVDRRNTDIARATGVTLQNPYDGGYDAEARDRLFKSGQPGNIRDVKEQIWAEQLGQLQTQYPDHADIIGADRPILDDAKQLADYWSDRAARGEPGLNATAGLTASFLGGMRGFLRNPLNVASLLVGGGEVRAASIAGKIAQGFIREAAVNAGQQALAEPAVQSWRAERGREAGALPALEDIGMAGLFGGVLGGGAQAAKALWRGWKGPVAPLDTAERASAGQGDALREMAASPIAEHAPGLRASIEAMDADAAAFADPPEGMAGVETSLSQAIDHGEGLSDALPEFMLPEADEYLAREALSLPERARGEDDVFPKIDARARELSPKPFAKADELDGRISQAVAEMERATANFQSISRAADVLAEIESLGAERKALRGKPFGAQHGQAILDAIGELQGSPDLVATAGQLQARVSTLQKQLESFTGKRRASPRAKAVADELADTRRAHADLIFGAQRDLAERAQTLRLALNDLKNERARLGPKLFAVRKHAAGTLGIPFDEAAITDIFSAARRLRSAPQLIEAAQASKAAHVVAAGRLASLGDVAFNEAASGRVSPEVAIATAARVSDEGEQLAVMRAAEAEKPRTADEAAAAVSREMVARAVPRAQGVILQTRVNEQVPEAHGFNRVGEKLDKHVADLERQLAAQPPAEEPPRTQAPRRPVTREFPTLFEALAGDGGLAPHPELSAIFDGNPFIPGFGRLLREGGRTLDQALTAAKELGYLFDPNEAPGAGALSLSTNDLLDLLRRERHGERIYSQADQAAMAERDAARAGAEFERAHKAALRELKKIPELKPAEGWTPNENILSMAATRMVEDPELAPLRAWDLAAVDYERDLWARSEQIPEVQKARQDATGQIPGWDIPLDQPSPFVEHVSDAELFGGAGDASRRGADAARSGEGAPASGGATREAGAGARANGGDNGAPLLSEPGAEGKPQTLIPGVAPVTDRQRAEARAAKPLTGGNAAPPAGGLFDEGARAQSDLFATPTDLIAISRDDGSTAFVPREKLLAPDPAEQIPDLILGCRD